MKAYRYKALSLSGKKISGLVEANDEFEAVGKIKESANVILEIVEVKKGKRADINFNDPLWVSEKVLALTASQFAILLRAGLPIARTVEVIAHQTTDKLMKRILLEVKDDLLSGYGLAQSLDSRGKKIPQVFIETVRAGEASGTLENSFAKLAAYYEKSYKLRAKVKGAMRYPIILIVLSIIVVMVVVNVAVPTVSGIIESTGGKMPWPTQVLLDVYYFFKNYGLIIIIALAILGILYALWGRTEDGKVKRGEMALKLPVLGKINTLNAASEFAGNMMTLLSSGLPTTKALSITGKVMSNYVVGNSVAGAVFDIEEGKRLGDVLRDNIYLPPLLTEMTAVGEESGSLEETLKTIGEYFDSEVEEQTTKAIGMLEPMMTIFLGIVIGFIVIALYLPMFTMYSGM
ncbi:MAG: type II secretion system F family protein [Clostridiales bacterium]|nr:type II secretion system F family protein [Clostridiales bacterium]